MENETVQNTLQKLDEAGLSIGEARTGVEQMIAQSHALEAAGHAATSGAPFVYYLAIFVMACFVGYYVVWSVTSALHTPLMSVTNAISSVIVVGAILAIALSTSWAATIFGFIGLVLASVNIFGGFLVTQRMLSMYKKKN
ncbi:proton-translocating transhydrogenase family protein [Fulvimarina sp. 2208YS6-2-32]|uniref:proton-translocating NAD(P)(+) transhydrogenase n=1 Tax=Fulvimarina uroteuthidis TaxID=3098149 RepID=A0ABU5I734_9HYPH|nr:proton-translocating transhydrogenase family protein [Fulvimarina sp. 2208YS6-2-32]MDY8109956.1 proton-translocating transhydrogenase family protein [Fulvimarina sp. 2208YS6-2-32]